jgi:hypothetical protein
MSNKDVWDKINSVSNIIASLLIVSATIFGFYKINEPLRTLEEKRLAMDKGLALLASPELQNYTVEDRKFFLMQFEKENSDSDIREYIADINRKSAIIDSAKKQVSKYAKESKTARVLSESFATY